MEEESESSNWILVEELDCVEAHYQQPYCALKNAADLGQESDSSISVISYSTNNDSEEELETLKIKENNLDTYPNESDKAPDAALVSADTPVENVLPITYSGTTNSVCTNSQWTFVKENLGLELETTRKFYLDCSQEPLLEISDVDTENTSQDINTLILKEESNTILDHRMENVSAEFQFNFFCKCILFSVGFLTCSIFIRLYLNSANYKIPSNKIFDIRSGSDKNTANFCIQNYKKESEIENCISKVLRDKEKDTLQLSELNLYMKERKLILKEKELIQKEKDIFNKCRRNRNLKSISNGANKKEKRGMQLFEKFNKRNKKKCENSKYEKGKFTHNIKKNIGGKSTVSEKKMKDEFVKISKKQFKHLKKPKNINHDNVLQDLKQKIEKVIKRKCSDNNKHHKDYSDAKWYIKFNPLKNTVELIDIRSMTEPDISIIHNGNGTINGQWYFSLYGLSRANIRDREKAAEWYFKRSRSREYRRDKAKWYFDYMSSRVHKWLY